MKSNLQEIINSPIGIGLALGMSKIIPRRMGYWLADRLGYLIGGLPNSPLVQAARANQWVVRGEQLNGKELNQAVRVTFQETGHSLFDFYHSLRDPQNIQNQVVFDPSCQPLFDISRQRNQGLLLVFPHLGSFDLFALAIGLTGVKVQILSYPQPAKGYEWQNEIRKQYGLDMTPFSISALHQANDTLTHGGVVMTGIDRPIKDSNYELQFFGRPAKLPVGHIRLALKAGLPIIVIATRRLKNGKSIAWAYEPTPIRSYADREKDIVLNAESVLANIEDAIRQAPDQWSMYYPVWPQVLTEIQQVAQIGRTYEETKA